MFCVYRCGASVSMTGFAVMTLKRMHSRHDGNMGIKCFRQGNTFLQRQLRQFRPISRNENVLIHGASLPVIKNIRGEWRPLLI